MPGALAGAEDLCIGGLPALLERRLPHAPLTRGYASLMKKPFSKSRHIHASDGNVPDLFERINQPMNLNKQQREGLANLMGDMAAALILGLVLAITMSSAVSVLTAILMCVFSTLLTVVSVFLRGTEDLMNDD